MKENLEKLKEVAEMSYPESRNKIGAVLVCEDDKKYYGFTIRRSSVLGSTCAERMALDNWYQDKKRTKPVRLVLIGKIMRIGWNNSHICYPCGVCRELYHQLSHINSITNFEFECYSWDTKNKDIKNIRELLYFGKPFYE